MRIQKSLGSLAFLIASCSAPAMAAEECGPLRLANDVQLITFTGSYQQLVPVSFNGASKLMLLDTGGYIPGDRGDRQ